MAATLKQFSPYDPVAEELWRVAETGDVDALDQIFLRRVDVNARNKHGMTALMRAAFSDKTANLKILISAGADINTADSHGETALMWARRTGRTENAEILLQSGAEDYQDPRQVRTALVNDPSAPLERKRDSFVNKLRRVFRIDE